MAYTILFHEDFNTNWVHLSKVISFNVWRHFWLSQLRVGSATGILWVRTKDTQTSYNTHDKPPLQRTIQHKYPYGWFMLKYGRNQHKVLQLKLYIFKKLPYDWPATRYWFQVNNWTTCYLYIYNERITAVCQVNAHHHHFHCTAQGLKNLLPWQEFQKKKAVMFSTMNLNRASARRVNFSTSEPTGVSPFN